MNKKDWEKAFSEMKESVDEMTDSELAESISLLEQIALEAKARLAACLEERMERNAH